MKIGFSSGSLRKCGMSFLETARFVKGQGANSFEISFRDPNSLLEFELSEEIVKILGSFDYLSIHAPFDLVGNSIYQDDEFTRRIMLKLEELFNNLPVKGIVFHPTNIGDFDFLDNSELPILIENMDIRKDSFKTTEEIKKLKEKYGFEFVLDLEHSFENDPSGKLTKDLIEIMGDRLKEVHLSGARKINLSNLDQSNHCLLRDSGYLSDLLSHLSDLRDIPIILEGGFEKGQEESLKDELSYVIKMLEIKK